MSITALRGGRPRCSRSDTRISINNTQEKKTFTHRRPIEPTQPAQTPTNHNGLMACPPSSPPPVAKLTQFGSHFPPSQTSTTNHQCARVRLSASSAKTFTTATSTNLSLGIALLWKGVGSLSGGWGMRRRRVRGVRK